ncbi:MAG: hypothetical protein QOF89_2604 [Acidobacteriota bacterium]|jgi:hypothetical protein|nr:hypothetical protein [Acidobacteriota bacterium]
MDQAGQQEVDVHEGLESTLKMLSYKLRKAGIEVARQYDTSLPKVCAYGSELNIARRIVKTRHKGEIRFEFRLGDTCFEVTLPLCGSRRGSMARRPCRRRTWRRSRGRWRSYRCRWPRCRFHPGLGARRGPPPELLRTGGEWTPGTASAS